jgi:hypothetical protein
MASIARVNRFLPPVPVPLAAAAEPKDEPNAAELDCGSTDVLATSTEGKTLGDIGGVDVIARFIEPTAKAKAKSEDNTGVKQDEADVWMGSFALNAIADYVSNAGKANVFVVILGIQKTRRDHGRRVRDVR